VIITRTPMRISYVGGGSDFQEHFEKDFGSVIGSTINQYIYVFCNDLSEVASESIRFTYRQTESVNEISKLAHPVLRAVLEEFRWDKRINLGTFSELPAGVGLGGSSAFTVGLINLLSQVRNFAIDERSLADFAVKIERKILNESGGWQDQFHAAYGGFRRYKFTGNGVEVSESLISPETIELLNRQQLLVWVGESRNSAFHAGVTKKHASKLDSNEISMSASLSENLFNNLKSMTKPEEQFQLIVNAVNEGWKLKRMYTSKISENVQEILDLGFANGASAAKLCGAGGSGFVLFLFDEKQIENLKCAFKNHKLIFPKLTSTGSEVVYGG
jgi:D-glycero-alpha-D-manno-heptose-7-phosphate kinase